MSAFLATVLTLIVSPMAMADQFLSLETAVKMAREANPGIAAKRALAAASEEVPSQAGALPDPVLMLNAMNLPTDSFSTSQENMTQFQVGVAQAFPYPGKLELLEESASHIAHGMRSEQVDYENYVVKQVRIVWWNILF
ncbi:Heavy metal RND efflux outer membrane protein, CzcC family, partial [hydrothermal vent metagenome]